MNVSVVKGALSGKRAEAVRLLGRGTPEADVARALGVRPSTLAAWKRDVEFRFAVREAAAGREADARGLMTAARDEALAFLVGVLRDANASPRLKLDAAKVALARVSLPDKPPAEVDDEIARLTPREVAERILALPIMAHEGA